MYIGAEESKRERKRILAACSQWRTNEYKSTRLFLLLLSSVSLFLRGRVRAGSEGKAFRFREVLTENTRIAVGYI